MSLALRVPLNAFGLGTCTRVVGAPKGVMSQATLDHYGAHLSHQLLHFLHHPVHFHS